MKQLIILEMANNHMGDVRHGLAIIDVFAKVVIPFRDSFNFAFKFQFRNLETFIHTDFCERDDLKYVKRFKETFLSNKEFEVLQNQAKDKNFLTICTAFDEPSVGLVESMKFDYLKIASCSFTDWPLLNRIVQCDIPIIASVAGCSLEEIDRVVSFITHREKKLSLLHCIGEYPTPPERAALNQITLLKNRYPTLTIGWSTHEAPTDYETVTMAIAQGARIIEKHIALPTEKYPPNNYSVDPNQMSDWLTRAQHALQICGEEYGRYQVSSIEKSSLRQFKRGVFAKKDIRLGDIVNRNHVYYAWPAVEQQVIANDMSKYVEYIATRDLKANAPIMSSFTQRDTRAVIRQIAQKVKKYLMESGVAFPGQAQLEISHHYGVAQFYKIGLTMITVVNRGYCKKLIIMLPNQSHPEQYHKLKEETFVVAYGQVDLVLDDKSQTLNRGDVMTIMHGQKHAFSTKIGCVIEEISSTHYSDDSYYTDENIAANKDRKTLVNDWL